MGRAPESREGCFEHWPSPGDFYLKEDLHGDLNQGSLVELRFKNLPNTSHRYKTIHKIEIVKPYLMTVPVWYFSTAVWRTT